MEWLQIYSEKLHLSRNAAALAQLYTDLYFSIEEYRSKGAMQILAAILMISSKYSDTKALDASILAYVLNLEIKELTALELEICWRLDFDLSLSSYNMLVDQGIQEFFQETGVDFYETDNQVCYVNLRIVHGVFEFLYVTE